MHLRLARLLYSSAMDFSKPKVSQAESCDTEVLGLEWVLGFQGRWSVIQAFSVFWYLRFFGAKTLAEICSFLGSQEEFWDL